MKWCAVVVLLFLFASGDKFLEHHLGVWIKLGLSPHDEIIHLSFALKQRNLDTLDKPFWQVSDPQSIRYGQFLTFQQLRRLVAPEPQGVQEVLDFFTDQGLRARVNPGGDYVDVDISVGQASSLLSATIESYQNPKTRLTYHRALNGYVLPKAMDFEPTAYKE